MRSQWKWHISRTCLPPDPLCTQSFFNYIQFLFYPWGFFGPVFLRLKRPLYREKKRMTASTFDYSLMKHVRCMHMFVSIGISWPQAIWVGVCKDWRNTNKIDESRVYGESKDNDYIRQLNLKFDKDVWINIYPYCDYSHSIQWMRIFCTHIIWHVVFFRNPWISQTS